ncbi:MAG TPA: hypothetical protein VFP12_07435 [Allosphingosinicella sp.]|nr:hypothetical protein [Allosphingosinicella sp.]
MRKLLFAGLVAAAQILPAAQPAMAAELHQDRAGMPNQVSAFAGARLRVPLGGKREKPQAGLALTSTLRSGATGELRFAKGAELGFSGDRKLRLSLAGRPVSQIAQGGKAEDGRKLGVSTLGWIGIGAAVAVVGTAVWFYAAITDDDRCCE